MRTAAIILLIFSSFGCGTMANLEGKQYAFISAPGQKPVRVYGGVRNNFEWIVEGVKSSQSKDTSVDVSPSASSAVIASDVSALIACSPIFAYFAAVDPVLSLVGDTLTLPYVLREIKNSDRQRESESSTELLSRQPLE